MRVTTTSDSKEFAAKAGQWLAQKPEENDVLLFHALDPMGKPPGDGEPMFIWITDAAESVVGAAFAMSPYRMTISGMPAAAVAALAEHLAKGKVPLPGVNGPTDTAAEFAARWSELTGDQARRERDQWLMKCDKAVRPEGPAGRPRMANSGDRDMVAEWFSATMRDSGMSPDEVLRHSRHMVEGQIAGERLIVWETEDGRAAGAAGWKQPLYGVVRPSGVFVSPEHRDGGYAAALLGEVTARALEAGADACVCTHFVKYAAMQAVVEKVGYRRILDLTEYRFG
jgi:predicted GNAT family acetyltransferase